MRFGWSVLIRHADELVAQRPGLMLRTRNEKLTKYAVPATSSGTPDHRFSFFSRALAPSNVAAIAMANENAALKINTRLCS